MEDSKGRPATQIEVEAFQAIANLQDENRELRLTIRQLKAEQSKICDICFTSSWQPCLPLTPNSVEDNTGGWMVCGYCRLVAEYEKLQSLNNEYRQALLKSGWQEREKG